jgi:hypothetical protein
MAVDVNNYNVSENIDVSKQLQCIRRRRRKQLQCVRKHRRKLLQCIRKRRCKQLQCIRKHRRKLLQCIRKRRRKQLQCRYPKTTKQGWQMVHFQTKNPNSGTFWRVLQWEMLVYFMDIRPFGTPILWSFGLFFPFWYVAPRKIWQTLPRNNIRLRHCPSTFVLCIFMYLCPICYMYVCEPAAFGVLISHRERPQP